MHLLDSQGQFYEHTDMNHTPPYTPEPGHFLFTSESVGEGHPGMTTLLNSNDEIFLDKMADQISDAILDACLEKDPFSKVACECALTTGQVMVFGEITSTASIDFQSIVRETIRNIGFDSSIKGTTTREFNSV